MVNWSNSNVLLIPGYGDAVSTMAMALTGLDQHQEIRCEAAYDGYERAMEYTLNIQLSKQALTILPYVCLCWFEK